MNSKRTINILMISSSSSLGGGTKLMFNLGKKLTNDFRLFYAIPKNNNFLDFLSLDNHIKISERKIIFEDLFRLKNFIRENSIDIIHAHGKGAGAIARLIKFFVKIPLIYTFHGIHLKCHNYFQRSIYILYEFLLGWIDSNKILVSKSEERFAKESQIYLGKKAIVINNGVPNMPIKGSFKVENSNYPFFESSKTKVISVCRFVAQKNIQDILKIASNLPEINFIIVGDGPQWKELNNWILEKSLQNIFLLGKKKNVFKYLYLSDIYLSTSLYEGLPISILEAMSIGLPVLASNVVGNEDTIEHEISGYLYDLNNINRAIDYLIKLDRNTLLRRKLGNAAFIRQRKVFSENLMIMNHVELYKNQIKKK